MIKKVVICILAFMLVTALITGCESKSKEELALESAMEDYEQAKKSAEEARNNYESLQKDVDHYKSA